MRELANEKAEKMRIIQEAEIRKLAEEKFLQENEHLRLQMEREKFEASEIIRKTKAYYKVSQYNNDKEPIAMNPTYFGEYITDERKDAWVPHGPGKFLVGDEVVKEGVYNKGYLHSQGLQVFEDDSRWEGEFKRGYMQGVGFYIAEKGGEPREALAKDNMIVCYKDELTEGMQVEFEDATMRVITNNRKPRATIMFHVRNWKYRCHFHDEIRPRERDVVFSTLAKFTILHHLPRIYHTTRYELKTDPPVAYNYYKDVYGKEESEIKLGVTGGRRTINMRAHDAQPLTPSQRYALTKSDRKENIMESAEVGIGAAKAEEEKLRLAEIKKKQFAALIEKRRADEEANRKALIEAEQKKILEEDLAKQKEKFEEAKRQKEADEKDRADTLEKAIKEETARIEAEEKKQADAREARKNEKECV